MVTFFSCQDLIHMYIIYTIAGTCIPESREGIKYICTIQK